MQKGFITLPILVLILIGTIASAGGYFYIQAEPTFDTQDELMQDSIEPIGSTTSSAIQRETEPVVAKKTTTSSTSSITSSSVAIKASPTPVVTQPTKTFSVTKFVAESKIDIASEAKQGPISISIDGFDQAPNTLSLCKTLVDEKGIILSETDCWPLETYGTWQGYVQGDYYRLAPRNMDDFISMITNEQKVKLRFELLNKAQIDDYSIGFTRDRHPEYLIATTDTSYFTYWSSKPLE